jgi:hypothetical protein
LREGAQNHAKRLILLWHADCSRGFTVAMKKLDDNRNFDQNWAWPERTWFRERLNAVRAREEKAYRRATSTRKDATTIEAKPRDEQESEEG